MLSTMNQIATVLGNTADASTFATEAANVNSAFNTAFWNSSAEYYNGVGDLGYRQAHNLLALEFGLTPNGTIAQVVADSVVTDIVNRGIHLNTGALSTKALLPMLSENGHVDTAYAVSQQTTFPSWGYWFVNGATTTVNSPIIFNHPPTDCYIDQWEHWLLTARSHDHVRALFECHTMP